MHYSRTTMYSCLLSSNLSVSIWFGLLCPLVNDAPRNKVIENQKTRAQNFDDETDMIDAFVACGGRMDKTGHVKR